MIAERPLGMAHVRGDLADQRELRIGDQRMRRRALDQRQPPPRDQRRQQQFRHVLGQRRDRRQDQRRRPAEEDRDRQRLAPLLGQLVVEAAALADLPVHARLRRAVHVHPVHPEVVAVPVRMLRVDERQRHERPAVLGPELQRRQLVEADVRGHHLGDGPARHPPQADARRRGRQVPRLPQLRGRRRHVLHEPHEALDEGQRAVAECLRRPRRRAEQVRDQRKRRALDAREQERGPARRDHAAVDLGDFETGIDRGIDDHQVAVALEPTQEAAKVGMWRRHAYRGSAGRGSAGIVALPISWASFTSARATAMRAASGELLPSACATSA